MALYRVEIPRGILKQYKKKKNWFNWKVVTKTTKERGFQSRPFWLFGRPGFIRNRDLLELRFSHGRPWNIMNRESYLEQNCPGEPHQQRQNHQDPERKKKLATNHQPQQNPAGWQLRFRNSFLYSREFNECWIYFPKGNQNPDFSQPGRTVSWVTIRGLLWTGSGFESQWKDLGILCRKRAPGLPWSMGFLVGFRVSTKKGSLGIDTHHIHHLVENLFGQKTQMGWNIIR